VRLYCIHAGEACAVLGGAGSLWCGASPCFCLVLMAAESVVLVAREWRTLSNIWWTREMGVPLLSADSDR
jgi:hypothetical protein